MLLNEFFGSFDPNKAKNEEDKQKKKINEDDLLEAIFEYILNNDKLHKEQFVPVAQTILRNPTSEHKANIWLPLVNKGCMEFYHQNKMIEDPISLFNKEFRKKMCERFSTACNRDILKGEFDLGK
jgi:hypothetical protein